jgi:broad specificity polyphosphatase/5'/3'-nucleotidase SurE
MGNLFMKGTDPNGRPFYWQTNDPAPEPLAFATDVDVVEQGGIALTPLTHDFTLHSQIARWQKALNESEAILGRD